MFVTADPLEMGGTAGTLTALTGQFASGNAAVAAPTIMAPARQWRPCPGLR